ncbi:MAG: hypothetical protein DMF72_06025 [Acidobacteria bacterium]|nr:MAG: hypothetical protein DMF72_06025 [Acidobacteriota bacterium]
MSTVTSNQIRKSARTPSRPGEKDSRKPLLIGVCLLGLSVTLLVYAITYRPKAKQFIFAGRIERIPPTGVVEIKQSPQTPTKDTSPSVRAPNRTQYRHHAIKSRSANPEAIEPRTLNRAEPCLAIRELAKSVDTRDMRPVGDPSPLRSAAPQTSPTAQKKNVIRRFFAWLAGLFSRKKLGENDPPNHQPPKISLGLSRRQIFAREQCPDKMQPDPSCVAETRLEVFARATDSDGELSIKPAAQIGKIITLSKEHFTWDLTGVAPGVYSFTVTASDGKSELATKSVRVTVSACECIAAPQPTPQPTPAAICPEISLSGPDTVKPGESFAVSAAVMRGSSETRHTYDWIVSEGEIVSGQGTSRVVIRTPPRATTVRVRVTLREQPACPADAFWRIGATAGPTTSVSGTIQDAAGAVISGATIILTSAEGRSYRTVSGANGDYEISGLSPGRYDVRIEVANFKTQTTTIEARMIQQSPFNFALEIGGIGEPVTITAESSPSPSPTPSATASPTPLKILKEQDQIKVDYPERFLQKSEGEITFEMERVLREVIASETNINGKVEIVDKPRPIPGATPDTTLNVAFGEQYEAYANVTLIPNGLTVVSTPASVEHSLKEKLVRWAWRLRPTDASATEASFKFQLDIVWKAKVVGSLPDVVRRDVWPNQPIIVPIGPPPSVKVATYSSPVLAAGGLLTLGFGARRRRRLVQGAAEDAPAEIEEESVTASVFAPSQVATGNSFLVQVFAHLGEQAESLERLAREADDDARRRASAELQRPVKRGVVLTFNLTMKGLDIDEPSQSCTWRGAPAIVQFGVTVPPDFTAQDLLGLVTVCEETVPIGHLRFKLKIVDGAATTANTPQYIGTARRYSQAFISYASQDRAEVLKRVQMLNSLKLKFFQDLLTLEPGDEWEKLIYQYLDASDVVFLFWSKAASESSWVRKEIQYAMQRKHNLEEEAPEIVPVIIEGPPPAPAPAELAFLHFNDRFMYFISATDAGD